MTTSTLTCTRYVVTQNGRAISGAFPTYAEASEFQRHAHGLSAIERREVPVRVPTKWAMFSARGNRKLTGYARALVKRLGALQDQRSALGGWAYERKVDAALVAYLAKWERCSDPEAHDTAVREGVASFHNACREAALGGVTSRWDDSAWTRNADAAYARVRS